MGMATVMKMGVVKEMRKKTAKTPAKVASQILMVRGSMESRVSISLEKRLRMRPRGVLS